jgi:hypothetical protein
VLFSHRVAGKNLLFKKVNLLCKGVFDFHIWLTWFLEKIWY